MSRRIEDRLRAALAAKADTVTEGHLQPPLLPQDASLSRLTRKFRRTFLWSAPVFAAAAVTGLVGAGVLTSTHHRAAPSVPAVSTRPTPQGPSYTVPSPMAKPPAVAAAIPTTTAGSTEVAPAMPAGGPVPAGFQPASVTFVSPTFGYVLGEPPSCASPPCTSLVRTTDRGAHWVGVPAPPATLASARDVAAAAQTSVSVVRFSDEYDGWAYGPGLWVTHDGARTWRQLDVGGQVLALEAGGGHVEAIVTTCHINTNCPSATTRLLSSPVGRDQFTPVASAPTGLAAPSPFGGASLTLHPPVGFADLGQEDSSGTPRSSILATGGGTWRPFPDPCSAVPNAALSSFVAPDTTSLLSLCTSYAAMGSSGKTVVFTSDGKNTVLGSPPNAGDGGLITANGISTIVVASSSGDDLLYRSTDSGRTWTTLPFADGGAGWSDLGFTTSSQAIVIRGEAPVAAAGNSPSELLMTTDAGATWHHVDF